MARVDQKDGCTAQVEYKTTTEDIKQALSLIDKADTKNKRVVVLVAWVAFAACMLPVSVPLSAVFAVAALYTLYRRWVKPQRNRNRLAKEIGAKNQTYTLRVFAKGISITEGNTTHRCKFEELKKLEDQSYFLLFHKQYSLMVIPKRYFGACLEEVAAIFRAQMTETKPL